MQDLLTIAIDAVVATAAIYFATGFVLMVRDRAAVCSVELPTQEEADDVEAALAIAAESLAFEDATPIKLQAVSEVPAWAQLDRGQLRKECSARAIKWRNAHGKNLHLLKAEMIAALEAIAV